jgi:hypothetical protein
MISAAARSSAKVQFALEREMLPAAEAWLLESGLKVKREFRTPWGICDLVGLSFYAQHVKQRLNLGQRGSIGPAKRIALLNHIPDSDSGKSITEARLVREFKGIFLEAELRRDLGRLSKGGFLRDVRCDSYQKLNGWIPLHRRIVALELKLNRVEEAFAQARSHLGFATHSYVGLPRDLALRITKSRRRADFVHEGIGIVGLGRKNCEVFLKPRHQISGPNDNVFQMHCVERFWRTMLKDN